MGYDIWYPFWRMIEIVEKYNGKRRRKRKLKNDILREFKMKHKRNSRTVFLIMTPEHENLGDHAIAFSEIQLLTRQNIDYVELTGNQIEQLQKYKLLGIMNGYPIIINGGGNLGTLWFNVEEIQRQIIIQNPRSAIVVLPNTLFYEESAFGQSQFQESKLIYNDHKALYLYAREMISYKIMKSAYKNVKLMPDMVLFMNKCNPNIPRHGGILCLREDVEKTRSADQEQIVFREMEKIFGDQVRSVSTVADQCIPKSQREQALERILSEFCSAKLVVTDRLHGMIFCAITGTPCIVINSKSPKVKGCYEWICNLEYICFVEDVTQISQVYQEIPDKVFRYDESCFAKYYQELSEDLLRIFGWG